MINNKKTNYFMLTIGSSLPILTTTVPSSKPKANTLLLSLQISTDQTLSRSNNFYYL